MCGPAPGSQPTPRHAPATRSQAGPCRCVDGASGDSRSHVAPCPWRPCRCGHTGPATGGPRTGGRGGRRVPRAVSRRRVAAEGARGARRPRAAGAPVARSPRTRSSGDGVNEFKRMKGPCFGRPFAPGRAAWGKELLVGGCPARFPPSCRRGRRSGGTPSARCRCAGGSFAADGARRGVALKNEGRGGAGGGVLLCGDAGCGCPGRGGDQEGRVVQRHVGDGCGEAAQTTSYHLETDN